MIDKISRRRFMQGLSLSAGAAVIVAAHADAAGKVCADPATMDSAQHAMRDEFRYTESAADPAQSCATCSFFERKGDGACGTCTIFSGPANAQGHCDSWGPKR